MSKLKKNTQCYFTFQRFPAGILKLAFRDPSYKKFLTTPPNLLIILTKYSSDMEVLEHIMEHQNTMVIMFKLKLKTIQRGIRYTW